MKIHKLMEANPNFGSGNVRLLKFKGQLTFSGFNGFEGFPLSNIWISGNDGLGCLGIKNFGMERVSGDTASMMVSPEDSYIF